MVLPHFIFKIYVIASTAIRMKLDFPEQVVSIYLVRSYVIDLQEKPN